MDLILGEFVIDMIFGVMSIMVGLMPETVVDFGGIQSAVGGFAELMAFASMFVPMDVVFTSLSIWFTVQVAGNLTAVINWVIKKIPTIS